MKAIRPQEIRLKSILPHPAARRVRNEGEEWQAFKKSIVTDGVLVDLEVYKLPSGDFRCIQGHRRRQACIDLRIPKVTCRVLPVTEEEALERLWFGDQHRSHFRLIDEIRGIQSLMTAAGATVEEIARKWGRPRKWVQSRHDAACLGKEVLEAIERPGRDRLTMEAVEEILKVPPVLWTEAVKLVLHPVMGTLDAEDARDVMRRCLKEPQAEEDNWRKLTPKLATEWRKRLRKQCLRGTASSLRVEVPSWRAAENMRGGFANAEELVGSSLPNAPADLLWLHVAVRHGLPVQIVPPDPHEGIRALVDRRRLQEAEAARSGLESEPWPAISKQKPGVESLERTPAITGSSRRKAVTPWEWPTATQADIIKIPSIQLGQWRGREISIRPTEDGHCEWVGIEDEKAVQRDWLKGIRKEKGWPWIQTVAKIAVRHWENLEQGRRPLPFAKAAWIHYRAHSGASGAE